MPDTPIRSEQPSRRKRAAGWLSQQQGFIWGTVIVGVLINLGTTWLITNGFDPHGTPLGWLIEHPSVYGGGVVLLLGQTAFAWWGRHPSAAISSAVLSADASSRQSVLRALQKAYTDELEASLQGVDRIALGLQERFDLTHPMRLVSWHPDQLERLFPTGTPIIEIFDQTGRGLLILGEPGAGKTTLLYELAQTLVIRAKKDDTHPLPVILTLSSWATKRLPLQEWAAVELEVRYLIPRRLGARWLKEGHLLLLLDGLDEVAQEARSTCIEEINTYQVNQLHPLIVCSRREEYLAQAQRLILQSAVLIQPLQSGQVISYLKAAGRPLFAVRRVLQTNTVLLDLLTSPLMLSVVTLAYRGKAFKDLPQGGIAAVQQQQIFASYLRRMLYQHGKRCTYPPQQMQWWLVELANQMQSHSQSSLYLERLQPYWLKTGWQEWLYVWIGVLFPGIMIGILATLMVQLFFSQAPFISFERLLICITPGGFIGGLLSGKRSAMSLGKHLPSFYRVLNTFTTLLIGLGCGLITFLAGSLDGGTFLVSFSYGATISICCILLVLLHSIKQSSTGKRSYLTTQIKRNDMQPKSLYTTAIDTLRYSLSTGGIVGLSFGIQTALFGDNLFNAISNGLSQGLSLLLIYGLSGGLIHFLLKDMSFLIIPAENILWSWKKLLHNIISKRYLINAFAIGLFIPLTYVVMYGSIGLLQYGLREDRPSDALTRWVQDVKGAIVFGSGLGLSVGVCYLLLISLFQGLSSDLFLEKDLAVPNQGIRRSISNGLKLGLLSGCIIALVGGFGILLAPILSGESTTGLDMEEKLRGGLLIGIMGGFLVAILKGGLAWWRHWLLRFLLWRSGAIPWNYVRFLDEAAQHILLRKVGGGYRFIHDLFRDYLASLSTLLPPSSASTYLSGQQKEMKK